MKTYKTITLEQASELSLNILVQNYNDAIETIWHLPNKDVGILKERLASLASPSS